MQLPAPEGLKLDKPSCTVTADFAIEFLNYRLKRFQISLAFPP